jgi:transcription elongation factor Elf1
MANLSNEVTDTFPCPHCGHEITQSLARLKSDPMLACPSCAKPFRFESGGTLRKAVDEIEELDRAWDNLAKG